VGELVYYGPSEHSRGTGGPHPLPVGLVRSRSFDPRWWKRLSQCHGRVCHRTPDEVSGQAVEWCRRGTCDHCLHSTASWRSLSLEKTDDILNRSWS